MMTFAEQHGQLAPRQYGSRKYHKAIVQVVNKILTFHLLRQLRWPSAVCSNDSKSCYGHIVHAVASLCMQQNCITELAIVCMFTTIQQLDGLLMEIPVLSTKGDIYGHFLSRGHARQRGRTCYMGDHFLPSSGHNTKSRLQDVFQDYIAQGASRFLGGS